jgi:hypothetical protein
MDSTDMKYLRRIAIGISIVVAFGYASNSFVVRRVSAMAGNARSEEIKRVQEATERWPDEEKNDRHAFIESKYWKGPMMNTMYDTRIPFVVRSTYYFENPFDYGQMGGAGYRELTIGFFWPYWTYRYSYWVH